MDSEKKSSLAEFSRRAMQRLHDRKVTKFQTLHIPSLDMQLKIRNLSPSEISECLGIDDSEDKNRSDKYAIYLAAVEPSLKEAAKEIMDAEAGLLPDQRTVLEPLDIVNIFPMSEITGIAMKVMELSGVVSSRKVTVVEALKN